MTRTLHGARVSSAMPAITAIHVTEVPLAIRVEVEDDARKRDLSVNAVVVGILSSRYGQEWESSRYPFTETEGAEDWLVRMPAALRDAIRTHARSLIAGSQRGLILMALADHYGLPSPSPRRRRGPATIDPDVVRDARRRHREGMSLRSLAREYGVHRETLTKAVRA